MFCRVNGLITSGLSVKRLPLARAVKAGSASARSQDFPSAWNAGVFARI